MYVPGQNQNGCGLTNALRTTILSHLPFVFLKVEIAPARTHAYIYIYIYISVNSIVDSEL